MAFWAMGDGRGVHGQHGVQVSALRVAARFQAQAATRVALAGQQRFAKERGLANGVAALQRPGTVHGGVLAAIHGTLRGARLNC